MPSNNRAQNQYYGKYRECCIVAHLNNEAVDYKENYNFSEEEKQKMYNEAKLIADFLGYENKAVYIGDKTSNESGDIKLDNGEIIEIKTVSSGTGTYFNTSIYYFLKFGFDFKDYMKKYKLYETLEENFGDFINISQNNNSPVNQKDSSLIRHNYKDIYEEKILPIDIAIRKKFTSDLVEYFSNNIEELYKFINDMLEKNSSTSKKTKPDRLIILNYNKKSVKEIDLKNFKNNLQFNIRNTDTGIVIGNIRIALSWQNGRGLNNPTIRVFLEE